MSAFNTELKWSDLKIIDEAFQTDPGYCLNFSNWTFAEFFEDKFKIDIDEEQYNAAGTSKMNRLRTFFRISEPRLAARVMRRLWEYRENDYPIPPTDPRTKERIHKLADRIEGGAILAQTDALERFVQDETLQELIAAIERDIAADKPAVALDRLHTYCAKKFGHLLDQRNIPWDRDEPLHSRVGKYVKAVHAEKPLQDITFQILKLNWRVR